MRNGNRPYPPSIHIDRNRTLQHRYRHDKAALPLAVLNHTFAAFQRAFDNAYAVSAVEKWPRLREQSGPQDFVDRSDLGFRNRLGAFAGSDDMKNARSLQDGKPLVGRKPAEDVVGEERQFYVMVAA
jgi:hypothetical protein